MKKHLIALSSFAVASLFPATVITLGDSSWNYNYTINGHSVSVLSGTITSVGGTDANRGIWQCFNSQRLRNNHPAQTNNSAI